MTITEIPVGDDATAATLQRVMRGELHTLQCISPPTWTVSDVDDDVKRQLGRDKTARQFEVELPGGRIRVHHYLCSDRERAKEDDRFTIWAGGDEDPGVTWDELAETLAPYVRTRRDEPEPAPTA